MNSITAAKDISGLTPVGVLKGITPMCVPYVPEAGIAEEVRHRAAPNIVSLWKRLGLVYFSEQPASAPVNRTNVTVNNFTAQLVFRVCSQNHTDRLIERYQPGFVFPEKIRLAGMGRNSSIRRNELRRMEELFSTNSRYTEEVSRIFRLVFEKETGGIPLQTVCRALAFLLGSTGGGAVFTAQQQRIFQRIATVLSAEYPESTAAQEVASVGAAAVFTEEQRRRILSAANVMGYRSQHDAAQRVLSLVNSGKTREEIGRVLLTEVRRYGLDGNSSTADTRVTSAYAPYTVRPTSDQQDEVRPGTVLPVNDVVHEIGAILYSQESSAGSPAENITSEILNGSSLIRTISDRVSSVISSERHSVSEYTDLVSRQILSYIQGHNVYPDNLKSNSGGTFPAVGLLPLRSENSSKFISVTAGTASRIIRQLSGLQQESPHTLLTNNIENSTVGNNFSETLAVMQKFSAKESHSHETERSFSSASPDGSQSYVINPQFSVCNDFSEPENVQVVQSAEAVHSTEKVVEKNESTAKNTTILSSGQTMEFHNTERLHTHSDSTELRTDADVKSGTVLPPEQITEFHNTERLHTHSDSTELRTDADVKPGTVLPPEQVTEFHNMERLHTHSDSTELRTGADVKPGTVLSPEQVTEFHNTERLHTHSDSTELRTDADVKPGTVLPPEQVTEFHNMERLHTHSDSTELRTGADVKPGTVLSPEQVTEFHNTERLHTHSDSTELRTDADVKSGTVLPSEQVTEFHNTERIHTENNTLRTQEISSYRSRLDARTLETLDRLVSESRSGSESKSKIAEEPAQLIHSGKTTPDTVSEAVNRTAQELRSVSIVRRSIVSETSLHIKKLMETAARSVTPEPAGKQAFTFRTAESGGNMVMLIPPAEADRYSASRPYNGKMPPIELKQPPEPQTERESSARKTTVNNRTVVKTVDNALDALSREDITRLADRVYERIENRLTRERRRMGM